MSNELLTSLAIFTLAILVGFEVISKVPATLHTPLMSGANSIHGIVLVGAMIIAAEAVGKMKSGSVIVDMAASALGGNVELSKAGETVQSANGVTIIAPDNLPASMPAGASAFYARNISALLLGMVKDGDLNLDFEDEVTKSTVISHDGAIVSDPVRKLLEPAAQAAGGNA